MKNEDIDKLIEEALTQEEAEFYHLLDEQNIFQMVGGLFKGKNTWINIIMTVIAAIAFALAVYFGIDFFTSNDVLHAMKTGMAMLIFLLMNSFLKLYQWNQMDKNAIIRELKRVELQVSVLSKKSSSD